MTISPADTGKGRVLRNLLSEILEAWALKARDRIAASKSEQAVKVTKKGK